MNILFHGLGNSPVRSRVIANHCENFMGDITDHDILTFGYNDGVDIKIDIGDDCNEIFNKLPQGWVPDFCLFWEIDWNLLPEGMEHAPCPTVALMSDWDYDIHLSKYYAESFDLVLVIADFEKEALLSIGAKRVEVFDRAWALREFTNNSPKEIKDREYDIVYTTFINDSTHPDRSRWILELCELSDKYNILVEAHLPGYKDYMNLLDNARLVFSHHRFGSMSGRVMEAGSQGAVVLDTGTSASKMLEQGKDYVSVSIDRFSSQIEALLKDNDALQNISGRIHKRVSEDFEARDRFRTLLKFIRYHLKDESSSREFSDTREVEKLTKRGMIYYYSYFRTSQGPFIVEGGKKLLLLSVSKFKEAMSLEPSARVNTNLAITKATCGFLFNLKEFYDSGVDECIRILKETIATDPAYVMAYFNLAILYLRVGRLSDAHALLNAALKLFQDKQSDLDLWCLHNVDYDLFNDYVRKGLNDNLVLYISGDRDNAINNIRNLYQAFVLYLKAIIEEKNGDVYTSLESLLQSERLSPDSRKTLGMIAQKLFLLGYKKECIEIYERLIELMPVHVGIRTEFIKVLYMYGMDEKLHEEIQTLQKIVKTIAFYKDRKFELRDLINSFTGLTRNPVYSYDPGREIILNGWLSMLTTYHRKDPKNINLLLRIIEVLHELRRTDKAFELVNDYNSKYGSNLNEDELIVLSDIHDYLKKAAVERNNFNAQKLIKINDQLSNVHAL